jgi:hypothetical protein
VSFGGGLDPTTGRRTADTGARVAEGHEEERRATRSDRLAVGTLACGDCDAPVALGARQLPLSHQLECPFCRHRGPVREFLSLAVPTRPARVVVRVGPIPSLPAR